MAISDIGEQIYQNIGQGDYQNTTLEERIIAKVDRLDQESSQTGPGENCFCDYGAGQKHAELESENGNDRDTSVQESVFPEKIPPGYALCAGNDHVTLVQFLQKSNPDHSGEKGGQGGSQGNGWKDDGPRFLHSGYRQQVPLNGKKQDQERS